MKFKQLLTKSLLAAVCLLVGQSAWGQVNLSEDLPSGSGEYFLRNVGTGTYLKGSYNWGTKAVVWDQLYVITLTYVSSNTYTIKSQQNNGDGKQYVGSGADPYVDGASANMTFTEVDAQKHYYTINNGTGNLYASPVTLDGANCYEVKAGDVTTDYAKWEVISKTAVISDLSNATGNNPKDASFYIKDADFDVKSVDIGSWSSTNVTLEKGDANNYNYPLNGGNAGYNVESYNTENFSLSQTLTDLPNGKYKVTCNGLYRANARNAFLFAGDKQTELMGIDGDANASAFCSNMGWSESPLPYWQYQAAACFAQNYFMNEVSDVVVTDGTLEIGVRKTVKEESDWACFDNFKLYYYGSCIVNDATVFVNGNEMVAGKWYYYDVPNSISYNIIASQLSAIAYTTDGTELSASANTSDFSSTQALSAGRYYFMSSIAQTLTFTPADYATNRTEEVYDFTTNSSTTSTWGVPYGDEITVFGSSYYMLSGGTYVDMKDRFAGEKPGKNMSGNWNLTKKNAGLTQGTGNGTRVLCILNLSAGDYVTVTGSGTVTFSGNDNITGLTGAVAFGTTYKIASAGALRLGVSKNNTYIKSIKISTSTPVLSRPTITFNELSEHNGLYYTKVNIVSDEEGVKFYDASDNSEITSPYTFETNKTLNVYTGKVGRTNSPKVSYTGGEYIHANSINYRTLYGTSSSEWPGNLDYNLTPFVTYSNFEYRTKHNSDEYFALVARQKAGSATCSLNEDMMVVFTSLDGTKHTATNTSNVVSIPQWGNIATYDLYVKTSATVSATTTSVGKGWATLYTPYALDFSKVDGLTAYTAKIDGENVTLASVQNVPANTGVVLKSSTEDADMIYSIPVTASSSTAKGDLQGSATEPKAATTENPIYILKLNTNDEAQFMRATTGSLAAGKAYLVIGSGEAKALSVMFANDPTGIANVNAAEVAQPVKRIVNGQLVIEKNGKRYNAAGAEF